MAKKNVMTEEEFRDFMLRKYTLEVMTTNPAVAIAHDEGDSTLFFLDNDIIVIKHGHYMDAAVRDFIDPSCLIGAKSVGDSDITSQFDDAFIFTQPVFNNVATRISMAMGDETVYFGHVVFSCSDALAPRVMEAIEKVFGSPVDGLGNE